MATDFRGYTLTLTGKTELVTETCSQCGVLYAMTVDFRAQRLRQRNNFYCPNGHSQCYTGPSDADKLKQAEGREVALRDQLEAAVRDAERTKAALLRDRHRFANGVCPCCNRSFENVARHMRGQHPDYDIAKIDATSASTGFTCSCGRVFESIRGLHQHQTKQRRPGWFNQSASRYSAHLTVV